MSQTVIVDLESQPRGVYTSLLPGAYRPIDKGDCSRHTTGVRHSQSPMFLDTISDMAQPHPFKFGWIII